VAIKTLRNMARQSEQLGNEAKIVSKLQHANIIPLYDAGEYMGSPYLVYSYIEGITLEQLLKKEKKLSLVQAAESLAAFWRASLCPHPEGYPSGY